MNFFISPRCSSVLSLFLLFIASTGHAEIYKWVDANGRTNFSERAAVAGGAKTSVVNLQPLSESTPSSIPSAQSWQEQEQQFRERQSKMRSAEQARKTASSVAPVSLSRGKGEGSDDARCRLAKDVLSGAVKHTNGTPTDAYDRNTAENDVRVACRR